MPRKNVPSLGNRNHTMKAFRLIVALWGILGISLSLMKSFPRLTPKITEAFNMEFSPMHWITFIGFTFFMLYFEGYKGFQLKYSPRTAARVKYLRDHPHWLRDIFAPIFCMGYFHANRKTKIKAYAVTFIVILMIIGISYVPQPWRGIMDVGVILGLSYGIVAFWVFSYRALTGKPFDYSPETPES